MKEVLRVKFKSLVVTDSKKEYEGSITLDIDLCIAAGLKEYDVVEVNNFNGHRDRTYVLYGDSGCCQINGALSSRHKVGDEVHVLAFEYVENSESGIPKIITTKFKNNKNEILHSF
jgi:aspartate 1-decarboxylase